MTQPNTTVVKPFAWSYSQLKNFETCAKRYFHYNVTKDVVEPESDQLKSGHALHAHFAARLGPAHTPLPLGFGMHEKMLSKIIAAPGVISVEQQLAITSDFQPTTWFGSDVWLRTVIDAVLVNGTKAAVFDWKDGKVKSDTTQLQLMAATLFVHIPSLQRVKAALIFTSHKGAETAEFTRDSQGEIWNEILPRVRLVERARALNEYPPKPSGLCKKYCAVYSCPYHGKGR